MKKSAVIFLTTLFSVLALTNVYAGVGQNDDEEISCEAVNQQNIKDAPATNAPSAVSEGSSAQGV